jgi:hypothetical protein
MSPTPAVRDTRAEALQGWREVIAYLEAHPELPVPRQITYALHSPSDLDGFERLAQIAHHLGAKASAAPNGTQRAAKAFGPATFAVVYVPLTTPTRGQLR